MNALSTLARVMFSVLETRTERRLDLRAIPAIPVSLSVVATIMPAIWVP